MLLLKKLLNLKHGLIWLIDIFMCLFIVRTMLCIVTLEASHIGLVYRDISQQLTHLF